MIIARSTVKEMILWKDKFWTSSCFVFFTLIRKDLRQSVETVYCEDRFVVIRVSNYLVVFSMYWSLEFDTEMVSNVIDSLAERLT